MKNLFENVYFGKEYKTRDNKKAILWYYHLNNDNIIDNAVLIGENATQILVDGNGKDLTEPYHDTYHDIVSEWQEEIDEEKLDRIAKEYGKTTYLEEACCGWEDGAEAFKAGYRTAKEE